MSLVYPELYSSIKTIIVTGATSGIGRLLAESLHADGKKVIICGRRADRLEEMVKINKGMVGYRLDVGDRKDCESFVKKVLEEHPDVDSIINNAGIQKGINFDTEKPTDEDSWNEEISINIQGLIRLSNLFIPHFKTKEHATIMNVTSGLGLTPMAIFPVYCATKAFVHSFSRSLRHQLRNTSIKVVEIIPPAVESELNPEARSTPYFQANVKSRLMPAKEFNDAVLDQLKKGELEFGAGFVTQLIESTKQLDIQRFNMMNNPQVTLK